MSDETVPPSKPPRAKTRAPASGRYKRKYPRDRLAAHGIENPKKFKRRKKKPGRPRKYIDDKNRLSPAYRKTKRWHTVLLPEEQYLKLKEMASFYKTSIAKMAASLVDPAFDRAYKESMTLARIEANREKDSHETDSLDDSPPPRRTHF